jgi:hypothetical protein
VKHYTSNLTCGQVGLCGSIQAAEKQYDRIPQPGPQDKANMDASLSSPRMSIKHLGHGRSFQCYPTDVCRAWRHALINNAAQEPGTEHGRPLLGGVGMVEPCPRVSWVCRGVVTLYCVPCCDNSLCRPVLSLCRLSAYVTTRASGRPACFELRVWVLHFWFGFALHSLALCRVCRVAPSFVSGWQAVSSVSLCKKYIV